MPNFYFLHKDEELSLANLEKVIAKNQKEAKDIFNKTLLKYKSKNAIKDFHILSNHDYNNIYIEFEKANFEKELSKLKLHDTCKLILKRLIKDEIIHLPCTKKQIKNFGLDKYNGQDFYVLYSECGEFGDYIGISWDCIEDDETGGQFKARINKALERIGGDF